MSRRDQGPWSVTRAPDLRRHWCTQHDQLIDRFELDPHKKARTYSKGNRQKVAIVAAFSSRSELFVLDEPTSALDPELVGEVLGVIRDLAVEGWTLVIVTHEIQFARGVSDQVLFTDAGVILEQGPPAAVIGDPQHERTRQFLQRILNPLYGAP